jgi:hypothetical protein
LPLDIPEEVRLRETMEEEERAFGESDEETLARR